MIEGLKVTVRGSELRDLATERADFHASRAKVYADQIASMKANEIEAQPNYTNGNPIDNLENRRASHANQEKELRFIAAHLEIPETYLLDRDALHRLGIVTDRY